MLEHAAYFAVLAFAQGDLQPGVRPSATRDLNGDGAIADAVDLRAPCEGSQAIGVDPAMDANPVVPGEAGPRKFEPSFQRAVGCQEQESLRG